MQTFKDQHPIHTDITVAWADMDALQHVNNVVYLRYFEIARIDFLNKIKMKAIHASVLDALMNFFSYETALSITDDCLEFGYKSKEILRFDIFDHLADYMPEAKAKSIACDAVGSF